MSFHFIRPLWLLALIPSLLLIWFLLRRGSVFQQWRGVVAEHLIPHVVERPAVSTGSRPQILMGVVLVLSCFSLAGPAWVREPSPFAEDEAALVVVLEVAPTMLAQDVQPSRLERATQKLRDLLELRQGAPTALVAYSGSAHLVIPLTEDGELVADFAAELSPKIMPLVGDAADVALLLAQQQLQESGRAGSILWVTDGVDPATLSRVSALPEGVQAHVFAVAGGADVVVPVDSPSATPLDRANVQSAADAAGGVLVVVTPDAADVEQLAHAAETRISKVDTEDAGERLQDAGYWLLPLIAVLVLFWFRPGWEVRYD